MPSTQRANPTQEDFSGGMHGLTSRLSTEAFGCCAFTLVDAGGLILGTIDAQNMPPVARSEASGLVIMALSYALSNVSGAHFNPAVTLAFALRGDVPWKHVPGY